MSLLTAETALEHPGSLYIDGSWVAPTSDSEFEVRDSVTEEVFLTVPAAAREDMDRAVTAAHTAFSTGEWPRMTHQDRAAVLRKMADGLTSRVDKMTGLWPRETGVLHAVAQAMVPSFNDAWRQYADLADSYPFSRQVTPTAGGEFAQLVQEPVGVVGAIVPWNVPPMMVAHKVAPALLAGCTVVLKASPEAPAAAYLAAEAAHEAGLPRGVLNVVTADREISETLVTDPRVNKISFTGSTRAGRRIGGLMGSRIGRYTLELGGKSAAVILDDYDIAAAAEALGTGHCILSGQVCAALTRIIVREDRHDEMVEALSAHFKNVRVGDPFDPNVDMGPLASAQQLERVKSYIAKGVDGGAQLATGGVTPQGLERGYFIEPAVFGNVDNESTIAQEEIFGPVLSVIPAKDEAHAIELANQSMYGLNASVFTNDADRALAVAKQLDSGTVGHNAQRTDFGISFGGFKQSGVGREGGAEGLAAFLESKTIILNETPTDY